MLVLLAQAGFFNASQSERLADAITLAAVTLLSLVPVLVALLQLKITRQIREIKERQEVNSGKIDKISRRGERAAGESSEVATGEVRDVQAQSLVRPDRETGNSQERGRDASSPLELRRRASDRAESEGSDPMQEVF